ncbi:MAG: hypothetical protein IJT69_04915 [Clostridia bacterium]|nr:hypothetical protein [Clostridia bacterium]
MLVGEEVAFGSYPQTLVTDEAILAVLNERAGRPDPKGDNGLWRKTSYWKERRPIPSPIYSIDLTLKGERYRGVIFEFYRSCFHDYGKDHIQRVNGYRAGGLYWFRYEPILWRVLEVRDGAATLLSERVLDDCEYVDRYALENPKVKGEVRLPLLPFQKSTLCRYLNEELFSSAFDEVERPRILPVTPEQEGVRVSLLSEKEAKDYASRFGGDDPRLWIVRVSTDYANAQGAWPVFGHTGWWARLDKTTPHVPYFNYEGRVEHYDHSDDCGILPVIRIKL